jgi:hypothetical protein
MSRTIEQEVAESAELANFNSFSASSATSCKELQLGHFSAAQMMKQMLRQIWLA